jgi:hypothetical protein
MYLSNSHIKNHINVMKTTHLNILGVTPSIF